MAAKIYSVVDGITTLDFLPAGGSWDGSIAAQLLRSNCADSVEEPFLSKQNNEERKNFNNVMGAWFHFAGEPTSQVSTRPKHDPKQASEVAIRTRDEGRT